MPLSLPVLASTGVFACAISCSSSWVASRRTTSLGDDAVLDDPVGRRDEAVLRDLREGGQRADQADVRTLGGLDRAHAPVVGRVHVADLDRRALAREPARAERREAAAVREPGERVRLVHELRELRGAEELLQRRHDGTDVDDRLRRDRVGVLGREALAHDALHAVQTDPEGLLDQLADGAQAAVAEVLVLVEVLGDGLARHADRLGRVVLDLDLRFLGQAETLGQLDQLAHQREDVVVRQRAGVDVDVEPEARVELVAPHAREVVALGVEEELVEQRLRVVDAGRLARPLLLEQLDQRALFAARRLGVRLDRVADVERVAEELQDLLVARVAHRAQQHRDRQLALAVDADEDLALLVDLELEPGAAGRHQVRDEDLLLAVLRLHQVGAGRTHELRHDDALGAVDHERPALGHPREVAHEDGLLADLARLAVDEGDRDRERARVGQVLLATLLERRDGLVECELAELHGEVAGVVLDRRNVVDRLAEPALLRVRQPLEGAALYVDQVGDINGLVQTRESTARPESICSSQEMTPSEGETRTRRAPGARPAKIAQTSGALKGRRCSRTPPLTLAYVARGTCQAAATIDQRRASYRKVGRRWEGIGPCADLLPGGVGAIRRPARRCRAPPREPRAPRSPARSARRVPPRAPRPRD